jgi:hypothetical protein
MRARLCLGLMTLLWAVPTVAIRAQEPGWWGVVIARGEDQARVEATPILERPYRPLHIYGNTVRRQYYRGSAMPTANDLVRGTSSLVVRRSW